MRKLLCLFLCVYTFSSCQSQVASSNEKANSGKVTILDVDRKSLSTLDKEILEKIDRLCNVIDSDKSLKLYQWDTTMFQNNIKTDLGYKVYYNEKYGINKLVSQGLTSNQKLNYVFYYSSGKLIKTVSENLEENPFKSIVYIAGESLFYPNEFSEESVSYMKNQAELLYSFFSAKL